MISLADPKNASDIGWLYGDIQANEIILETSELNFTPIRLKVTFMLLCNGILNSRTKPSPKQTYKIDYEKFDIRH